MTENELPEGAKKKMRLSVKVTYVILALYVYSMLSLPFAGLFSGFAGKAMTKIGTAFMKPQHEAFEKFMKAIETGDAQGMNALLDEQLQTNNKEALEKIISDFKALGQAKNIYFMNFDKSFSKEDGENLTITYWADFENGSESIIISMLDKAGAVKIDGFNYIPTGKTYGELFKFPLWNISVFHYLFAFAAFFMMYFTFSTLVMCLESDVKLKWLWVIFISLGFGTLGIVWRESPLFAGTIKYNFTSIILFSVSAEKVPIDSPMLLKLALPLGAIVFRMFMKTKDKKKSL